ALRKGAREGERAEAVVLGAHRAAGRGQDERRARLVDEDAVRLVDDAEIQPAQDEILLARGVAAQALEREVQPARAPRKRDAVAQIIERKLLVRAVGDCA